MKNVLIKDFDMRQPHQLKPTSKRDQIDHIHLFGKLKLKLINTI